MNEIFRPDEQYANWKAESDNKATETESGLDFKLMGQSFADGTAGEYYNNTGALPVEAFLEEQGDDRVLSNISPKERDIVRNEFIGNVSKYNLRLVEDKTSLMAIAA
jgi:hypothetical protein